MGRGRRHAVMKAMPRTCIDLPDDFPFSFLLAVWFDSCSTVFF